MCFRPAAVEMNKVCPECGEKNGPTDTVCKACGAELFPGLAAPGKPSMPGAPKPPGVPGAPSAPAAPGVPSAPAAPKAPTPPPKPPSA